MTGPSTSSRRRDQSGYTLLIVLMACGLFAVMLMSLLAMVGTDARALSAYTSADAAKRAVDGALQLGVGQVKAISSTSLANPSSPCAGFTSSRLEIEGRTLAIDCSDATDMTLPAPRALPAADSSDTTAVLSLRDGWDSSSVVTNAYSETSEQTFGFGPLCQNLRIGPLVTCINENLGISPPTLAQILNDCRNGEFLDKLLCPIKVVWRVLSGGSGLLHVGDTPLQIYGSVDVAKWGLSSALSPSSSTGLKLTNGTYRQGESDGSCSPTVLAELGNLEPSRTGAVSPAASCAPLAAPAMPTPPTPTTTVGEVPATSACVSGGVVSVEPGAFDAAKVTALNALFASAACNNVTFWFKPGSYFFDGASVYNVAALNFNNATSNFVFGAPRGWVSTSRAPDAVFPEACDRSASGVSIVLGPTTSIVHNAGAVAICGNISQTVGPAVLAPVTMTATSGVAPLSGTPSCFYRCLGTWPLGSFATIGGSVGDRPVTSAKLLIKGKTENVQPQSVDPQYLASQTRVTFTRTIGATTKTCTVTKPSGGWDAWPVDNMDTPFTLDLFGPGSTCGTVITTQADIENGSFSVDFDWNRSGCVYQWWTNSIVCNGNAVKYTLDSASVTTTSSEIPRRTPMPMTVQVDPAAHRTFNVFGSVVLPYSQIDIKWWQTPASAAATYTLPVFVGAVDARALFSHPGNDQIPTHIGTLASRTLQPLARQVRITVSALKADGTPDRIVGSTIVTIVDEVSNNPSGPPTGPATAFAPGSGLTTSDWRYCNVPYTATANC